MIKPGSVFTIQTGKGVGYFQYILKNRVMGSLIRVIPQLLSVAPNDVQEFVNKETNF